MRRLSFVYPFYLNRGILAEQDRTWASYPVELKEKIEIVIVDDGSPDPAATVPRPEGLPPLSIYRVTVDLPWHQHAARNIGAKKAKGPWLLLTDMDHVVPAETLWAILRIKNKSRIYTFDRVDAPAMTPTLGRDNKPKPHPNSFVIAKRLYWEIGGYDEEYCGTYGTDGLFRSRAFSYAKECHLSTPLIRYSRDVIPDASTTTLARKEGRDPTAKAQVAARKFARGEAGVVKTLTMPFVRAL